MKIAFFHNLPTGGAKRVLYEQVKFFSRKSRVDIYEISDERNDLFEFENIGCKIYRYTFVLNSKLPRILARLSSDYKNIVSLNTLHKKIAQDIDNGKYNFVIVHPDRYTQAPYLLRYLKTHHFYYCHELLRIGHEKELRISDSLSCINKMYESLTRKIRKAIDKKNAMSAMKIIANSNFIKRKVKNEYGKECVVCYPGIDPLVFRARAKIKKNKILFVGEPNLINGYNLIEESLAFIEKNKRPKIDIVNFLSGNLILSDKQLSRLYSESLLTVCLSYNEPFGMVALESMACETPVIAVNEGGYKETVINGVTGFMIKRNPTQLAKRINDLTGDRNLVKELGENGRREVLKRWTWSHHFQSLEKIVKKEIL